MFKNFFLLNRHVLEVNQMLSGFVLVNAFTQEKDKLVFSLKNDLQEYFIELSTDSSLPYFIKKNKYNRAKKNTLDFFESYLPSKLISIKIAELDRVIQFNLDDAAIYFYIHGKETNIILIDKKKDLQSFKKIENKEKIIAEISKLNFSDSFQIQQLSLEKDNTDSSTIGKKYPFLRGEIIDEMKRRSNTYSTSKKEMILQNILSEIETKKPFVYRDAVARKNKLSFFYRDGLQSSELTFFDNVNDALKFYITLEYKYKNENQIDKEIVNKFEKKIIQLEKKHDHIQARINEGCKDHKYQQNANLLLMNIDNIKNGMNNVELKNIFDSDKIISIDLIPKLSLRKNVSYYFEKAKSERKEYDKLKELLSKINEEIKKQKASYAEMENSKSSNNEVFFSKIIIHNKNDRLTSQTVKSKFRQFILQDKYLIFVGRNSKNNDELTTSFAKQNDYWFHARSVSGSHVVLRWDKSHGEIQKIIIEKTASLAAFYSKAKTSGLVPVSYTQKKYVIKRKGMEHGKVHLLKEKVLIVKPEIPKDCKLVAEE
jgi:predicted ribosome quality control (RQC) complex YloA/Tae2 family protein